MSSSYVVSTIDARSVLKSFTAYGGRVEVMGVGPAGKRTLPRTARGSLVFRDRCSVCRSGRSHVTVPERRSGCPGRFGHQRLVRQPAGFLVIQVRPEKLAPEGRQVQQVFPVGKPGEGDEELPVERAPEAECVARVDGVVEGGVDLCELGIALLLQPGL